MPISPPPSVHTPTMLFRGDLSGTAFGGAPTWTDLSAYVLAEGQGQPVEITWGRADEEADVTPRQMVLIVDNQDGRFTPKRTASPYYPYVRRGFRGSLQLTVNATVYDRFDGYCAQIEQAWPGGDEGWSVVRLTFTDITARLAIGTPLRSMVIQEMLLDSPAYLYPMDEASGSVSAGNISAVAGGSASLVSSKYGAGTVTFGSDTGLLEGTGVAFAAGTTSTKVTVLNIPRSLPATGAFSLVYFLTPNVASSTDYFAQIGEGDGLSGVFGYFNGSTLNFDLVGALGGANVHGTMARDARLHSAIVTVDAARTSFKLYVDGILASSVSSSINGALGTSVNQVGGIISNNSVPIGAFPGTVSLAAMFPSELSAARALAYHQAGAGTLTELSGARYARIASYGNVTTSGLPTGQATIGGQKTDGKTLTEALAQVARTEGTPSFATGAGALTFQARNLRYNATAAVTLDANDVESLAPRDDGQGFFNDITVTRDGGASQRVIDAASQTQYGRAAGPNLDVCPSTDEDALQHAYWEVGIHKDPDNRLPDLTVDLLTQPTVAKIQGVLACTVSSLITVSGLPANAPSSSISQFVEGAREVIGLTQWDIAFYTSPNLPPVWVVEDPVLGVIDSTNRLAF